MPKEASLVELKDYFGLSTTEFMKEWKNFNDDERKQLKVEVGEVLYPDS